MSSLVFAVKSFWIPGFLNYHFSWCHLYSTKYHATLLGTRNILVTSISVPHPNSASCIYWWVVWTLSPDCMRSQFSTYLNPTSCVNSLLNLLEKIIPKPCALSASNITDLSIDHILGAEPFPWIDPGMLLLKPSGIWLPPYVISESPNDVLTLCDIFLISSSIMKISEIGSPRCCKAILAVLCTIQ